MKTTISFDMAELELIECELDTRLQTIAECLDHTHIGGVSEEDELYKAEKVRVTKVLKRVNAAIRRLHQKAKS